MPAHTITAYCWAVRIINGPHAGLTSDMIGHAPTREETLARKQEHDQRPSAVPGEVILLDHLCHQVECNYCSTLFGDDEIPGDRHYRRAADAETAAAEQGWRWAVNGRPGWWCPGCITWRYGEDYYEREAD